MCGAAQRREMRREYKSEEILFTLKIVKIKAEVANTSTSSIMWLLPTDFHIWPSSRPVYATFLSRTVMIMNLSFFVLSFLESVGRHITANQAHTEGNVALTHQHETDRTATVVVGFKRH